MHEKPASKGFLATRRRFGVLAAGAAASLACGRRRSSNEPSSFSEQDLAEGEAADIALSGVPCGSAPEATIKAVRSAASAATDFSWLTRGDSVLIKPACNSGYAYPATTDPLAVKAMIDLLREQGAGRILVADMSGVQYVRFSKDKLKGSTRTLMHCTGLAAATESSGGELHAFEEEGWDGFSEERPRLGASWKGAVAMPKILEEIDHVVLMPRCARHVLAGSTLGLKAAVGWWRHDSRLEYHHDAGSFAEKTVEANTVNSLLEKQRLVVTSATRVLTTFGPDKGWVHAPDTGLIIAGPSVVAHDMVSLAWLLQSRRATPSSERDDLWEDPYGSAVAMEFANRLVTLWLGGFTRALTAQGLAHRELESIWDDRILRHAFALFGGVPRVNLIDAGESVPSRILQSLESAVRLPA